MWRNLDEPLRSKRGDGGLRVHRKRSMIEMYAQLGNELFLSLRGKLNEPGLWKLREESALSRDINKIRNKIRLAWL